MNSVVQVLPANRLVVDSRVQRVLDPARVSKLVRNWKEALLGILTVSERVSGSLVVLDGQTRLEAIRVLNGPNTNTELPCQVRTGLTEAEEAELFLHLNDRKAVSPLDRFRIALVAEESWAIGVYKILSDSNWCVLGVDSANMENRFAPIMTATRAYERDNGASFGKAVRTFTGAWGNRNGAATVESTGGLTLFFQKNPDVQESYMSGKLAKWTPGQFSGMAADRHRLDSMNLTRAGYVCAVAAFNKGRKIRDRITV